MANRLLHSVNILLVLASVLVGLLLKYHDFFGDSLPVDRLKLCLKQGGVPNVTAAGDDTFRRLLNFSAQNLRFSEAGVRDPDAIILPHSEQQVQTALKCFLQEGSEYWELRVRSGGHSYEGLSYTAYRPFVIIDMMNMNDVAVDVNSSEIMKTAWIGGGATLGEIYLAIASKTPEYGFPAGLCPTVGSGGHFAAGGYGFLSRKYGVAGDNILDAKLVAANLSLLNRASMGEELFWALRGGGGGSWGIVVAWEIQLVKVTPIVTTFRVTTTDKQKLAHPVLKFEGCNGLQSHFNLQVKATMRNRWLASACAPEELEIVAKVSTEGDGNILGTFYGQYLGSAEQAMAWFNQNFPNLELGATDCKEGTWIEAMARIGQVDSPSALANRSFGDKDYFKAKSDYVKNNISEVGWNEILTSFVAGAPGCNRSMLFEPYGGAMWKKPSNAIAFPHRSGNLFSIEYVVRWYNDTGSPDHGYMAWLSNFYNSTMTAFVSQDPRAAYVGFIDLDLGNSSSVQEANKTWGRSYFLQNFDRLVQIKTRVDHDNVFRLPQSIPVSQ